MTNDVTQENGDRAKSRTRSPSYPSTGLEDAIRKADALYEEEDRHLVPLEAAAEHWGYAPTSSAVLQTVAALRQFGLLIDEGSGKDRRVRLSDLAIEILEREDGSPERENAIQTAALNPRIHRELWLKYEGKLPPSNSSIRYYLVREREEGKFNKDHVDGFIDQFRSTIAFARLAESDKMPSAGEIQGDESKPDGEAPQVKPQDHQQRRQPMQQPGTIEATYPFEDGQMVLLQWPKQINPKEYEDLEAWFQIMIRKVKRSVRDDDAGEE